MTKNQINYLLLLATLVVFWLYFHTFFMASKMDQRVMQWEKGQISRNAMGGPAYPNMGMPRPYANPNRKVPSSAEIQKMIDMMKKNAAVAPTAKATTPATPAAPEKK